MRALAPANQGTRVGSTTFTSGQGGACLINVLVQVAGTVRRGRAGAARSRRPRPSKLRA